MSRPFLGLLVFAMSCAPAIVDDSSDSKDAEVGAPGDAEPGDDTDGEVDSGGGDDGGSDGGDGEDVEEEPPPPTLESGDWKATDASVISDPCDWVGVLADYYRADIVELLPSEFEVEGEEGVFQIEAQSYGARGPITCTITGDVFSCEQQEVVPVFYDIGDYGWVYEIDFAGEVVDEQTIRGTAVVSYPSVDSTTAYWLEYGGIRAEDCDQTLELELSFDD